MPRPKGHKLSPGTKILIAQRTRERMRQTRYVACPHCRQHLDRWTLYKAPSVVRKNLDDDDRQRLALLRANYAYASDDQVKQDMLWVLSVIDDHPAPHLQKAQPQPTKLRPATKLKIRRLGMSGTQTTVERAVPTSSVTRRYALYRVAKYQAAAIRVPEVEVTDSLAKAILEARTYHEDGDHTVQVHWFENTSGRAPSVVEYPAYETHVVNEEP